MDVAWMCLEPWKGLGRATPLTVIIPLDRLVKCRKLGRRQCPDILVADFIDLGRHQGQSVGALGETGRGSARGRVRSGERTNEQ